MSGCVVESLKLTSEMDWFNAIEAVAAVFMAGVAFFALRSWKAQEKAKRQSEFLDELIEGTHTYIAEVSSAPLAIVKFIKIGMRSFSPSQPGNEQAVVGAIKFIEEYGESESQRLLEALGRARPSVIKLRSLEAKGQVFDFDDYSTCHKAIQLLSWQFDRMEAFLPFMRIKSLNWENPEVIDGLKKILAVDADEISQSLAENNVIVLGFVKNTYRRLYS